MESSVPVISFKKRGTKANIRKRAPTPPPDLDSESGFSSFEDESGHKVKRRKKTGGVTVSSVNTTSNRDTDGTSSTAAQAVSTNADDATKASNWYDEEHDKSHVIRPGVKYTEASAIDGTYKGAANYQSFIQSNPDRSSKQVGPQKASTNVRTITVTDFAPDVCKDYKQTGFCGFGDSCKFLHAREDYKQGWQLDREWEIDTKGKKLSGRTVASADRNAKTAEGGDEDEALLEKIPFACVICKKPYSNPIVTKCNHYFCESCALKRYRKDPSCAVCGAGSGGVFNVAKKLNRLLERKRERMKHKRDKAIENGEEPPPVEEGE